MFLSCAVLSFLPFYNEKIGKRKNNDAPKNPEGLKIYHKYPFKQKLPREKKQVTNKQLNQ